MIYEQRVRTGYTMCVQGKRLGLTDDIDFVVVVICVSDDVCFELKGEATFLLFPTKQ